MLGCLQMENSIVHIRVHTKLPQGHKFHLLVTITRKRNICTRSLRRNHEIDQSQPALGMQCFRPLIHDRIATFSCSVCSVMPSNFYCIMFKERSEGIMYTLASHYILISIKTIALGRCVDNSHQHRKKHHDFTDHPDTASRRINLVCLDILSS